MLASCDYWYKHQAVWIQLWCIHARFACMGYAITNSYLGPNRIIHKAMQDSRLPPSCGRTNQGGDQRSICQDCMHPTHGALGSHCLLEITPCCHTIYVYPALMVMEKFRIWFATLDSRINVTNVDQLYIKLKIVLFAREVYIQHERT